MKALTERPTPRVLARGFSTTTDQSRLRALARAFASAPLGASESAPQTVHTTSRARAHRQQRRARRTVMMYLSTGLYRPTG
jgi:hypothetical protein